MWRRFQSRNLASIRSFPNQGDQEACFGKLFLNSPLGLSPYRVPGNTLGRQKKTFARCKSSPPFEDWVISQQILARNCSWQVLPVECCHQNLDVDKLKQADFCLRDVRSGQDTIPLLLTCLNKRSSQDLGSIGTSAAADGGPGGTIAAKLALWRIIIRTVTACQNLQFFALHRGFSLYKELFLHPICF